MRNLFATVSAVLLIALIAALSTASAPDTRSSSRASQRHASEKSADKRDRAPTSKEPVTTPSNADTVSQDSAQQSAGSSSESGTVAPGPTSGPVSWTANPFVVAPVGLVILIALGLHFVHISNESKLKQQLSLMSNELRSVSAANRGLSSSNHTVFGNLSEAVDRHDQTLAALHSNFVELDSRVASIDSAVARAADATTLITDWLGTSKIQNLSANGGSRANEDERRKTFKVVARYKELFAENAKRVREIGDALERLITFLNSRPYAATEIASRAEELREGIREFERLDREVCKRLTTLERVPFAERHSAFRYEKDQIANQLSAGQISVAVYVQTYRRLIEQYFPNEAQGEGSSDPSEHEQYVQDKFAGTADYLMDWFDSLYQLHSQVKAGAYPPVDAATASELAEIQRIAEETLAKFDIQSEEINVGLTCFDRRLHDSALVMQRSNLPANTIVGVQQCGFRRLSTGDVLRRPRVVVSGAGAI